MNKYFGLMQMPIVTSQYWNMVHGACPEDVRRDLEGLQTMRTLGNNMAFFINCKNLGLKMGLRLPDTEAPVHTNFIRSDYEFREKGILKPYGGEIPFAVIIACKTSRIVSN